MVMVINLPWPPRSLSPNARIHWARKAKDAKQCRLTAFAQTKLAGVGKGDFDLPASLKVTCVFAPPDHRRRDLDNMLSACKSLLDGVSDAIGIDDSKWHIALRKEAPVKGGSVRIELEQAA